MTLLRKLTLSASTVISGEDSNFPITTTQNVLNKQYISEPILKTGSVSGTVSLVIQTGQANANGHATLAVVIRVMSQDGSVSRGTLLSIFGTDTEYDLFAAPSTRIINEAALTPIACQDQDRLVIEIGAHVAAPTAAGSAAVWTGTSEFSDYELTSGLTTTLNPWVEFSGDFVLATVEEPWATVGDGMSSGRR